MDDNELLRGFHSREDQSKTLWPICGQNSQHTTDSVWERMRTDVKNARNSVVAATFEKANTYVFAALIIRDREVGGSNPLAPTN